SRPSGSDPVSWIAIRTASTKGGPETEAPIPVRSLSTPITKGLGVGCDLATGDSTMLPQEVAISDRRVRPARRIQSWRLQPAQRIAQIVLDIIDILKPDRYPNDAVRD